MKKQVCLGCDSRDIVELNDGEVLVKTLDYVPDRDYESGLLSVDHNGRFTTSSYGIDLTLKEYGGYRVLKAPDDEKPFLILAYKLPRLP